MDLYLSNCYKAAEAAATKAAASSLTRAREHCDTASGGESGSRKKDIPEVGAANLLDLPLGVKLPIIPGSNNIFYTTNINEKLYHPSYDFNLSDPYCRLLETSYKSLHDPHLKAYHKRKDILRRLKKGGYITSNNKVICTLKELNKYRQYLTTLKLDFERNYVREQKMIEKQVNKLYETRRAYENSGNEQFQEWLLQEDTQASPDQELIIRHRYLDMISRELGKAERAAGKQSVLRMKEEQHRHQDHVRRKLRLRRQIEEEWKTKEMLLLTKIGDEVKREAKVEEQRQKVREEAHRKKQALLEKKIAYHLQKMQRDDMKRDRPEENVFENKGQDQREASSKMKKTSDNASDRQSHQEQKQPSHSHSFIKIPTQKSSAFISSPQDIQKNKTELKSIQKDKEMTKTSHTLNDKGMKSSSLQTPGVSAKTENVPKHSLQAILKQEVTYADVNEKKAKKPSFNSKSAQGNFSSHDSSIKQHHYQNCCQKKVTSEELNSIVHNIMTWVVAAVTSILYPAITKYEERLQNIIYPIPDDSTLSSNSVSCCSTCSEMLLYETCIQAETFQAEACADTADRSIGQPATPIKPSAHKEKRAMGKKHRRKGKHKDSEPKYNKTTESPKPKTSKSDTHLSAPTERGTKKSEDAITGTDALKEPPSSDERAKVVNEMQELKNVFDNFKYHLKEESEVILENIFHEMMSELTKTIPSLTSVTAETLVDQTDVDKGGLLSKVNISSAAAEIMEIVLEKLQSAVEKKCTEVFSQENLSVHFKSDLTASGEHFISPEEKTSKASPPYTMENMSGIAEDMVHVILEKLTSLASSKQNELAHLEITTKPADQQHQKDPTYAFLQRASKSKSSAEPDAANLISKEDIQNLVSNIFSQSSLVGYIEEAINTILSYIQIGLSNERIIASEETMIIHHLLDDLLAQLHQKPAKTDVQKRRHPRLSSPSGTEEGHRLSSTRVAYHPRHGCLFPPINVPGMVLYSEDENKEIDKIVENVLISSIKDEKAKLQEQVPDRWFTRENADLKYKRNMNLHTKPTYQDEVAFHNWGLKTDLSGFNNKDLFKDKPCLNRDLLLFCEDEKHQIQKASEDIITSILSQVLQDLSSGPSDHSGYKNKEASLLTSGSPQDLSNQEWMNQMFCTSEIQIVAQEIVDAVLKILHVAYSHIIRHSSSVPQISLDNADILNKEPLKIWLESKRNTKDPWLEPEETESTPEPIVHINDKITYTVFKKLNSFICPKLQNCFKLESHAGHSKPEPDQKSSFQSHLSTYTTKVVKIVLDAIQKELKYNKKNLKLGKCGPPKDFIDTGDFAASEKELDSIVTKLNNDIMTSSLATCICELLSGNTGKSNILLPSDTLRSKISYETAKIEQKQRVPSQCPHMQEEVHRCTRLQVLDRIGDTLCDMLHKLIGYCPCCPRSDEPNREWIKENLRLTTELQSNIQLISYTILEGIIGKFCSAEMDHIFTNSEFKAISDYIDTDSLSFALLIEEMGRCSDIIASMLSSMIQPSCQEVTNNNGKTTTPKTGTTKEEHPNKLEIMASDIFEMVFAKLKGFAKRNLDALGTIINGNKKSNKRYWESESFNICANTREKQLESALYMHAKKVSSTILKAIQTELNVSLLDLETGITKPLQEKEMLKNLVDLILDAEPLQLFNETEQKKQGIENYRYRPTYGNFLPGGADPESYLDDPADTEKKSAGEERPTEETKSESLQQWELERTFKKFEVELKEPEKSPVVPIIRNILNEIFQNDLIDQLNVLTLSQSPLCDIPHPGDKPVAQKSVQSMDKIMAPLVSEADVTAVADNVVRTILQKLYSAVMADRNASENRSNIITCPAIISFPEYDNEEKSSLQSTILDRNPCIFQSTFSSGKMTKMNVVEDIIQSVLTNLETFATSKVKALFRSHINFTIPMALPLQEDETASSQPWLSTKDSYSGDQFSYCSMDHDKSGKTTSICQLTACKLNSYATEVARQILQGIKHKLDKEIKSPFLIHNIVVSGNFPSQIVNTVLSIVSTKGEYEKNLFDRDIEPGQPEDIVGKLFNKSDYQKKLQFQILDTIEGILSDICEKTLDENNLLLTASTLNKFNVSGKHLEANSETNPKYANKAIPMLLVPKSCVTMISSDMVDIVLQNLTSAIMLGVNAKDSISLKLPLAFSDSFPKAEHQRSPVTDSMNEGEKGSFLFARKGRDVQLKSVYSDDYQTTVLKKQDAKQSADPCEESVHFITKAISNRLKSFATERIDMLLTLDTQTTEKTHVGPELTNCKQNSVFLEAHQMPSDVNVLEISTARTVLSQEVTDDTFANYRKKHGPAVHISQACLREYADIIASTILMLIKNDIDLEIQKMYSYPNNTSFQENIIASETVNSILRNLHDKISLKATKFYSQQNPSLFTQLVVQNEILTGQRKMDDNTELSLFSKHPYQNQIISEAENLRRVLEEIFRNGDSRQEKTALLSAVKEILKKVYQRVMEDIDHWLPFTEPPHFTSDSKMKTAAARKKTLQSHISSVANDIVESVSRKMFSIVMTSLYEKKETRQELEASGHDELLLNPPSFQESKQAERRSVPPEHVILRVCPYTGVRSATSLENTLLQFSPWRVGEELVQKVLKKITNFVLLNLEENLSPKDQSDGMQSPRPCSSNASLRDNPNISFKTNFKAKSEVISLPKCGTKPQLGPSGAKAKSQSKLSPREKTFRGSQSSTAIGLPYRLSAGDAQNSFVRTKLPTAEFKMHAKDIISNILEKIVSEFQKLRQNRLMVNVDTLTSDQIMTASKMVNAVLQGLYAMKNDNSADQIKASHSHDLKLSHRNFRTISLANPEVHFSLENVSSQLEKIFPKEGIFTQMFDEWQTEANDVGNEKYKLLMVAESVLNEILVKTKELEQSVSLLNLSPLEGYESRRHNFKRAASGAENSQAQISIFGQEIVKKLLEKLDMYFMTQMFITDGKEMLESKKETTARSQGGSLRTNNLNNVPIYNTKLKDKIYEGSSHQIAQELMEGVLNTLESFADLQFKHISPYAFSEIVKIPIENFFAVQQKPFMKTILPELKPRNKFANGSKSCSMISQENMHYNTLRQLHSFHLELLTYTANTVNDMLGIIKNKVDKGKCEMEPSSISIFEKNTVASQIISTLMDECTHFCELMIKSHPKENLLKVAKNAYTANWPGSATGMGMFTSESEGISCRDDLPQIPGLSFYSEKDRKVKEKASSNLPSNVRNSAEDTLKTTEPLEGLESELKPLYSRSEARGLSHFEQVVKGNSSLPLPKPFQKSSDTVQAAPEHPMSFTEMEGENPKVLHYECPKPVKPNHIQTTISPLKIGIAAENIVNTMLLSYDLPSQTPYSNESIETMKPSFVSKEGPLSMMSEEQKDEKSLLKIWEKRINSKIKEENQSLVASGEDFTLLEKWKDRYPKLEEPEPPEEAEVIAFADQELGPKEIHLVARYVTTAVVTHFKNFETRDEKIIRNVLDSINDDSHVFPSCITVLPRSLLEDLTYKLLAHIFPSCETETELSEKEVPLDYEFVNAASKLTDEIITEISEHEIRLATAEEHVESMQLGASENFVNSICNNIMKNFKLENEAQSDTYKNGGLFLRKIAGFIMKEIVDHHLQPFLYEEESLPCNLPKNDHIIEPLNPDKEKILTGFPQASVYSATFLEDVIIDLVSKFYTLPSIAENPKDKEITEKDPMGMAVKFANGLIGEFRKSKIKVLANSGKMFSFPPIDKETVNKISDSVYDEVIEMYGSYNVQKDDSSNIVIEMIAALAKKAISAFKIQPLFSGDWSSTFFSFLNVDNIIQKVQHLPYNTFTKINRSLRENPVSSLEQLPTITPLTSGLKDIMNTLEIGRGAHYGKENFKKEKTSMKTGSIQEPICTTITSIMKGELTTLASGLVGGVADKKKGDEKKKERSIGKENEKASKATLPTTNMESEDTQGPDLSMTPRKKESKKKHTLGIKEEKGQRDEVYQHLSSATDDTKTKKVALEPALKMEKKKSDKKRGSSLEKDDRPSELPSLKSKVRDRKIQEKRRDSPAYGVTDDKQTLCLKQVQIFTESIYRNVLEMSPFQEPEDDSKSPIPLGDKAVYLTQADGKGLAQPTSTNPGKHNAPAKEEENKKSEDKEIKSKPSKPDHPPENNHGIFPANFLGDVLSEIVNKLVFNSLLGTDDTCQNVTKNVNQTALDDTAMKLIDSLLKEFSDAQIKVMNPGQGSQFLPSADIVSSVPNIPLRQKEPSVNKAPREKKMAAATKVDSSDEAPSMANIPSSDKMLVNKIVHSSLCNILQEYRSQDSIYKDINSNGGNLARKLANTVIEEIFQHQLNLLLYEEVPEAACLPLESKEVMKKVHKVVQTACKECQTSSPYTIMLPYEFLESIISSLLSKIFSTVASAKAEISEDHLYTELYFLQMKLISTIMTEISKDNDMIVKYVESLHPNDDEIIQLVVQTIYNNLLPQFGSQKSIQNCVSSGCKILSETIVNLVVQEVAGNQLQNYFSGELTPHQCTEVDSVVENILKDVIQTTEVPRSQPSQVYKLPFHIIEEIAVNFLSKLLSMFPKVGKKQNNSLHAEMQTIISKILSSFQDYLSKSQIIVVPQAEESPTVSLADSTTIEKVVTSVYNSVLRHSGSHISVYKDLMSKSNVLSDIIGFLMVKEISNSELHPRVEEEASRSELVLEAVKIMEKVVKIIDDLKSKKKPSTKKETVLDARFLEEMLALFLAKLVKLPSASSRDAKNLSKSEVNKIASQLTKSVTAEIARNNISVVAANPEENFLSPESIEIISQIVESVFNQVLQQSGTHEELYYDMKGTNSVFPKEVASLLISKVSNCPLEVISSKDSEAGLFGDLDLGRIVEKVHDHAVKRGPELEQKELGQDLSEEELPVKIIPHRGKQPISIDPDIVAEHLGVISIKTQPLEKLQLECLTRTGRSIEALRRVSASGRSHSMGTPEAGKQKREKRISLDEVGRLNVKPLETASRNSFQNLIKPDITKVELLKDVHSKKDLIIRLVTHDINQEVSENKVEKGLTSDEDEVVLQDVVRELPEEPLDDQVKEDIKPIMNTMAFSKPPKSKRNLKKFLSLGKCCQCKSTVTTLDTEASPNQWTEAEETQRTVSNVDVTTSKSLTGIDSSFWKRKTQLSREGRKSSTEPAYYFLHRIMSSSSYNEEDLPSFSSDEDDRPSDPSAKVTEESFEYLDLENASSIKFITLYQRESALASLYSSNDGISDAGKPSTSKHGSEMMKKVSTALSKVFSRSNASASKSSSPPPPPHQDRS
ncbi:fibrous sheath-interacting protein 2-like isoform X3 [Mustela erminea]|uniref:fibrous sheath-interacting protein 2-like isoform X3 n=1 Tax=Mustela erminea TaxID=36723 RepID=UPI001386839E|nr:fibrous sheath-interacting protein 2-like isoform X3 [Mustela erminea]